jgi:hypothetical protein
VGCSSDLPFLDPYNDTRGNLALLTQAYGVPAFNWEEAIETGEEAARKDLGPYFSDFTKKHAVEVPHSLTEKMELPYYGLYEPSPCVSNTSATAREFLDMLDTAVDVPDADKGHLAVARLGLLVACGAFETDKEVLQVVDDQLAKVSQAAPSQELSRYLKGAGQLYSGDYAAARETFLTLAGSSNTWIKETALYLVGRSSLLASQTAWDGYGSTRETISQPEVAAARSQLQKYIETYPQGRYTTSARNLMRRVAYLGRDDEAYATQLTALFDEALKSKDLMAVRRLVGEVDASPITQKESVPA